MMVPWFYPRDSWQSFIRLATHCLWYPSFEVSTAAVAILESGRAQPYFRKSKVWDSCRVWHSRLLAYTFSTIFYILWPDHKNNVALQQKLQTRQIWGIWKLRPAYNPETPNLGQNWWCFVPCDLEIWWMTLKNNRAPLLCCFKLCATFHSHQWIQTGVAVRKRPIWVKFDDF